MVCTAQKKNGEIKNVLQRSDCLLRTTVGLAYFLVQFSIDYQWKIEQEKIWVVVSNV